MGGVSWVELVRDVLAFVASERLEQLGLRLGWFVAGMESDEESRLPRRQRRRPRATKQLGPPLWWAGACMRSNRLQPAQRSSTATVTW